MLEFNEMCSRIKTFTTFKLYQFLKDRADEHGIVTDTTVTNFSEIICANSVSIYSALRSLKMAQMIEEVDATTWRIL
jgi:hypothetical protein